MDLETARRIGQIHCNAWSDRAPKTVAERYAEATHFTINGGEPMTTRAEISDMAAGFMDDFPDLVLSLDSVLVADRHMVYAWTFVGHHMETGRRVKFSGWEEWDLDDRLEVTRSLGWYDEADYERQVTG